MTMKPNCSSDRFLPVGIFFAASFLLHLLWENLQAPLYAGFTSFTDHFWICFRATWGDLLLMLVIYIAVAIIHRNPFWVIHRAAYAHLATWTITSLIGVLLAVNFELWAVYVDHRWQYTEAMPLIPMLQVGLAPVSQMVILPLVTLFLTSRFSRGI